MKKVISLVKVIFRDRVSLPEESLLHIELDRVRDLRM